MAVLTVSAILSIAGNAYHAVLTATVVNSAVAAAIAALAPAMVLTMSEIVAVVLRAPRRRRVTTTIETPQPFNTATETARIDDPTDRVEAEQLGATKGSTLAGVDEDLDNGLLKPAVWTSVYLYLAHPDWTRSDIARHLELHTSTVSRHIKTWTQVQQNIASERSTAAPTVAAGHAHSSTTTDVDGDHGTDDAIESSSGYDAGDYDSIAAGHGYAGATR